MDINKFIELAKSKGVPAEELSKFESHMKSLITKVNDSQKLAGELKDIKNQELLKDKFLKHNGNLDHFNDFKKIVSFDFSKTELSEKDFESLDEEIKTIIKKHSSFSNETNSNVDLSKTEFDFEISKEEPKSLKTKTIESHEDDLSLDGLERV